MAASVLTAGLTNHCPDCNTCLEGIATTCLECGRDRPEKGWSSLYDSPFPYLGRIIDGRYIIDRFLDSGASGHVYRARGLRFKRFFALKVVDAGRHNDPDRRDEALERFQREVETMSRIRNPHVVGVYEALELAEGVYGLLLDFIDGFTLDSFIANEGLPALHDAVAIIQQVANGLHEAHRSGIIHRDLKPQNIMIEKLPASGFFARVLDFGIAQIAGADGRETSRFLGTPLYASPEQCLGGASRSGVPLDARSDIYSLGCLFFNLLTGKPPFPYNNALRVMDAHIEEARPRVADLIGEGVVPAPLENLISHMMARDPQDRPRDLHLVHQDLTNFLRGQPLIHFGATPEYRLQEINSEVDYLPPASDEFISLGDRTSMELAADPTFGDFEETDYWKVDSQVEMELLFERDAAFLPGAVPAITAACLDRRALACMIATPEPRVHFLSLDQSAVHQELSPPRLVTAAEIDLSQGALLLADVRGELVALDLGTNLRRQSWQLPGSPLAIEIGPRGFIYYGTERGSLGQLDRRTDAQREIARLPFAISALHITADRPILCGLWDGSIAQVGPSGPRWHIPLAPDTITNVGYLSEDHFVAIDVKGTLYRGDARSGELLSSTHLGQGLRSFRTLDDGRLVGLSAFNALIQVWNLLLTS